MNNITRIFLPVRYMLLSVQDSQDDVTKGREWKCSAVSGSAPSPVTTAKVYEMKTTPPTNHSALTGLVDAVLVDMECEEHVGVSPIMCLFWNM